jgi:hypothetical protein
MKPFAIVLSRTGKGKKREMARAKLTNIAM